MDINRIIADLKEAKQVINSGIFEKLEISNLCYIIGTGIRANGKCGDRKCKLCSNAPKTISELKKLEKKHS